MNRDYLTRNEAADYIRISVPQLDILAREKKIKRVKFGMNGGARVLYRRVDLDEFVAAHLEEPEVEQAS